MAKALRKGGRQGAARTAVALVTAAQLVLQGLVGTALASGSVRSHDEGDDPPAAAALALDDDALDAAAKAFALGDVSVSKGEDAEEKDAFEARAPKVDPALLQLVDAASGKGGDLWDTAKNLDLVVENSAVGVELSGDDPEAVAARVRAAGGEVKAIVDQVVYADLPIDKIEGVGKSTDLHYMTREAQFEPTAADPSRVISEGVRSVQVEKLHAAGINGKGVRVGVLDFGFQRYTELQQKGEVPVPQAAWSIPGGDSELLHRFLSASQRFEWGPEDQQPSSPDSQTSSSG